MNITVNSEETMKARQFRELCRCYKSEKKWLTRLETSGGEEDAHLYAKCLYLRTNVEKVEAGLRKMRLLHGEKAGNIIRRKYIEGESFQKLSREYGIPVRTMQRRTAEWMKEVDI